MNYPPNAEAVIWFDREIFPLLSDLPRLSWKIVGWGPPPEIQALHDPPAIQVTGFVEDVRPYLIESQVVIVPLLSGSGTRLKILEAWAMGKAVVSTSLGAQGLPAVHGENILLADKPRDFAEAVIQLLGDPVKRNRLGQAGRQLVEAHFSWHAIGQELARAYQNVQQARAYPTRV
jgi:glycosyltransferase involved in cell wall biosynthesis